MAYSTNGFLWRRYPIINLNLKKNTFFSIFNGYHETGIHASELHRKTYDSEKKFATQLYPSFFFYEIAIWKTNFNIFNLMPIDWRSSLTERFTLSGPESQQSSSLLNSPTTVWKSLLILGCPRERRPIFRLCNLPCCNPPSSRDWQSWENVNTNTAKQTRYIKINEEAG